MYFSFISCTLFLFFLHVNVSIVIRSVVTKQMFLKKKKRKKKDARKKIYIIQDSLFAKWESFLFDFIDPHNLYLVSGIPQIYVAADKNKINNPVLL